MTHIITDPYIQDDMNKKINQQTESMIILNNQVCDTEKIILIFLNKSKYSTSITDLKKNISKYFNKNICIYGFHYNEIFNYIGPFKLTEDMIEHLNNALINYNKSYYNYIIDKDIKIYMHANLLNNENTIYY